MTRGRRIAIGIASGLTAVTALTWLGIQELGATQNNSGSVTQAAAQSPVTVQLGDPASSSAAGAPAPAPTADPSSSAAPVPAGGAGPAVLSATTIPKMGSVVTDKGGFVLYRFDKDTANPPKSNCLATCAQIWPPVLTQGAPNIAGVDPALVGTVARPDGTMQVTIGGWPIYNFSNEKAAGQWKGQGVGGTWWVIAPDGKKNLTCVPSTPPPAPTVPPAAPTAPPADNSGGTSGSGTGTGTGY